MRSPGLRLVAPLVLCTLDAAAQPLRQLAEERGIRIGTAVQSALLEEPIYAATLAREFNQVEPESEMKFGPIHPAPHQYRFSPADTLVAFARRNRMAVRGHTLVWHRQQPAWVTEGRFTPAQLSTILHEHIRKVVGHYAGTVYAWDVVNESFREDGSLRPTIWFNSPGIGRYGTGYIEQAFRWAKEADPRALLFYNDYNAEDGNAKSDAIYQMAREFKTRGVPIDGVGLQMHLTTKIASLLSVEANIRRLTELGLQIQITELDVRLPVDAAGTASVMDIAKQAEIYGEIVSLCLKFSHCTAIQTWGVTDQYSWIPGEFPGQGAALLFDPHYQTKAAYQAFRTSLSIPSRNWSFQ